MADTEAESKPQPPTGLSRWTPSIPTNLMSMLNPFTTDDSNKPNGETTQSAQPPNKRPSMLSSFLAATTPPEPVSPHKDDNSIMFDEPDTHSNSDDASRDGSVDESGRRPSKRNKSKTSYSICHPAPTTMTRQKLHRRPRSLLQLHKLSSFERPRPAYEIVPAVGFSVRLTRAIKKVYRTTHSLCTNDLVVMRAEKYSAYDPSEEQETKDIVCLICKGRKDDGANTGKAKICLPGGREWEAYCTPIGGYEFFTTDEHGLGLTVRWVPKKNRDGSKQTDPMKRRFNFSTISPNSRRHPVIATLSRTKMEINDTYKMPNPSAVTPLSTPRQNSSILADAMEDEFDGMEQCETDDRLRDIVVMTGIWVAFKEGWSPNFRYDDKEKDTAGLQRSPSLQYSPSKAATFASPASTPPASPGLEKRHSWKSGSSMLRSSSLLRKGNRSSAASVPEVDEDLVAQFEATRKTGRARADSASTVLVHRAASNRAKHHQATWRPDLLDAQREVSEPSSGNALASNVMDSPFGASPTRSEPLAQPILPSDAESANGSVSDVAGEVAPTPRRVAAPPSDSSSPEKRESSTTTATASTTSEVARKPVRAKTARRKSGWRRILCGSGQDI